MGVRVNTVGGELGLEVWWKGKVGGGSRSVSLEGVREGFKCIRLSE